VVYVPGRKMQWADALSRWAYPASKAFADTSIHGSDQDDAEMKAIIHEEQEEASAAVRVLRIEDCWAPEFGG
jgi:hypothetical protein